MNNTSFNFYSFLISFENRGLDVNFKELPDYSCYFYFVKLNISCLMEMAATKSLRLTLPVFLVNFDFHTVNIIFVTIHFLQKTTVRALLRRGVHIEAAWPSWPGSHAWPRYCYCWENLMKLKCVYISELYLNLCYVDLKFHKWRDQRGWSNWIFSQFACFTHRSAV